MVSDHVMHVEFGCRYRDSSSSICYLIASLAINTLHRPGPRGEVGHLCSHCSPDVPLMHLQAMIMKVGTSARAQGQRIMHFITCRDLVSAATATSLWHPYMLDDGPAETAHFGTAGELHSAAQYAVCNANARRTINRKSRPGSRAEFGHWRFTTRQKHI